MIGSALCGTAENITQLGIYRAIQGIGGGALVPIAFTIVLIFSLLKNAGKWAVYSEQYLVYRVFLDRCLARILQIILAGTGYFTLTYRLAF